MPLHRKIHLVFHASMLKSYHEDNDDLSRAQSTRVECLLLSLPHMIGRLRLSLTIGPGEDKGKSHRHAPRPLEGTITGGSHMGEI
ncbi:hypothetical protein KY285_030659 [Solanum tuberosum]|nr:hypothetical protein KY285_030659 [Solanum tuberosum]